jgi:diguanylate cyclase (GGDEF)-like protein
VARWCLLLVWLLALQAAAAPLQLHGRWVELTAEASGRGEARIPVERIRQVGGRFEYQAAFDLAEPGRYVIDFKNSSVVGLFVHRVLDAQGGTVAEVQGGLQSSAVNPFFLRHGRELALPAGHYTLVSRLESPFFLAQPEPYLDTVDHYRQAIKLGNALALICLGVFIGLGSYYAMLGVWRRRMAEAMYAVFIAGNLLYNSAALLVASELFGVRWFYLVSAPILLSNIAYVMFVMALLDIRAQAQPVLHRAGRGLVGVLAGFIVLAVAWPEWSLEFDRLGVALFLIYGMTAAVSSAWRGDRLGRLYLVANTGFFIFGFASISLLGLDGVYTLYVEHLGLAAVTIEVLLLALVLSYQFGMLQETSGKALAQAEHHLHLAHTDSLTGLPNRYSLELALASLPPQGSLTFVDLDGLKLYNDRYGHARGDELLRDFANTVATRLGTTARLHRLGGDEFAVVAPTDASQAIERIVEDSIKALRLAGYGQCGASFGSVLRHECDDTEQLKHLADTRMYAHKRRRRVRDEVS